MSNVKAKIEKLIDKENSNLKAIASVTIADMVKVNNIRIMNGKSGLFVAMPQNAYEKNGEMKYDDLIHPITADARKDINNAVLMAYDQALDMQQSQGNITENYEPPEPYMEQSM